MSKSKSELAYQHILAVRVATSAEIAAAVPGLLQKDVASTLKSRIKAGLIAVETTPGMRLKTVYKATAKALGEQDAAPPVTHIPPPPTHAMTSHLKTGTTYGPGAHGGPIRDTGPARDKGRPVTIKDTPRAARHDHTPAPVNHAAATAQDEASEMATDMRAEQVRDLKKTSEKSAAFWLADNGGMLIEDPGQTIYLRPSDTVRLFKLLTGSIVLSEVPHAC